MSRQVKENLSQQKRIDPGVYKDELSLLAYHIRRKYSIKTPRESVKVKFCIKSYINVKSDRLGSHYIWSSFRMTFNIHERETSHCLIRTHIDNKIS